VQDLADVERQLLDLLLALVAALRGLMLGRDVDHAAHVAGDGPGLVSQGLQVVFDEDVGPRDAQVDDRLLEVVTALGLEGGLYQLAEARRLGVEVLDAGADRFRPRQGEDLARAFVALEEASVRRQDVHPDRQVHQVDGAQEVLVSIFAHGRAKIPASRVAMRPDRRLRLQPRRAPGRSGRRPLLRGDPLSRPPAVAGLARGCVYCPPDPPRSRSPGSAPDRAAFSPRRELQ
jgi:hypothetical protein